MRGEAGHMATGMLAPIGRWRPGTEVSLALLVLALAAVFGISVPTFLSAANFVDLVESYSVTGILALGVFVVLLAGGIDISFAAIASVAQYVAATLAVTSGWPPLAVIGAGLATGVALSLVNAFLIERMAIPSIIATIATMTAYFSTLMAWTGGRAIYTLPDWWTRRIVFWRHETDGGDIVRIGLPIVLLLVTFAATHLLVGYARAGRQLRAVGGNAEAARRIGVRIGRVQMIAYGYLGLCAALAGLLQAYRVGQAVPNAMVGSELNVVAAAVLGGASLTGGRGSAAGVMLGILLLAMLQNGLTLLSVPSFHFQTVIGAVLLLALVVISRNERRVLRGTGR